MLDISTTGGVVTPSSFRERDDNYHGVLHQIPKWRVIRCKDGIQWIVQRAQKSANGGYWQGKSYCSTKEALVRVWLDKTGDRGAGLAHLSKRIGDA